MPTLVGIFAFMQKYTDILHYFIIFRYHEFTNIDFAAIPQKMGGDTA